MRLVGRITDWNDDRGFGFVVPNGGGDRTFVHVKAFDRKPRGTVSGLLVSFEVGRDGNGRTTATNVQLVRTGTRRSSAHQGSTLPRTAIAATFLAVLVVGWFLSKVPTVFVILYAAMSMVAVMAYAFDKSAAMNRRWRTQESTLHLFSLMGGWPGALYAQGAYRHKSAKASFQAVFWTTVIANCGALAWLLATGRAAAINQAILGP